MDSMVHGWLLGFSRLYGGLGAFMRLCGAGGGGECNLEET